MTLATAGSFFLAPAGIDLYATAAPANSNTSIAKVEFFNGATLLATLTAPPYIYRWNGVAAGYYGLTAKATDSLGASLSTQLKQIQVDTVPSVSVGAGLDGSTINDDNMQISGTLKAPANSGITVNGMVGIITSDGKFFFNNVPLKPGSNTLTVTVATIDGQTATQTITVTSTGPAAFQFAVNQARGYAPLTTGFSVTNRNNIAIKRIELICAQYGPIVATVTTVEALSQWACTYNTPGMYQAQVNVVTQPDPQQPEQVYSATQWVYAEAVQVKDMMLRGLYNDMLGRLKAGDITGALKAVTAEANPRFNTIFTNIPNLSTAAAQLGVLKQGTLSDHLAEYFLQRNGPNGVENYIINLIPCEDGIWRIDSM